MTHRKARLGVLLSVMLVSSAASAAISKGPYLIFEGSNTQMTVLWQTTAAESNTLRWGVDTTYSLGEATVGVYGSSYQHKHVITGLQPNTMYYYQIVGYGAGSFRTAPDANATSAKFLVTGDTRTYPANQEQVAARMRATYGADDAFQGLVLHTGDWVAGDAELNWTNEWFASGSTYPNMHALQAEVPIAGVRGNHEASGTYLNKYFPFTYAGGFYRSFDYGPVHVVLMDTYTSFSAGSIQYNWLVNDLASTTKPWKILVNHEPGWGAGDHPNNTSVQTYVHPLVKQYDVDAFINGHNHNYARCVTEGKNYITSGGGGAPLSAVTTSYPNVVTAESTFQHMEVTVEGNVMTLVARRPNGTVIETITVAHSGVPTAPTALLASAGDAQVSLAWSASAGATSYNVKRSPTDGGPYTTVGSTAATEHTDVGLANDMTYYYVVTAVNASGESGNSNQASATPSAADTTRPTPPVLDSLVSTGKKALTLDWTASSDNVGVTGYEIYRATGSCTGTFSVIATAAGTATSYTNTSLRPGTTYCYYLVARDAAANTSTASNQLSASAS